MEYLTQIGFNNLEKTASDNSVSEATLNAINRCEIVDLFCGVGGLTHGFIKEAFKVKAGIDNDASCRYAYEANNNSAFIEQDVNDVKGKQISELYTKNSIKILVGCAPCQPFSSYNFKNEDTKKWFLLHEFARLVKEVQPDIVSMENVPQLLNFTKASVFQDFLNVLKDNKYEIAYQVVDCPKYGIPQKRKRLVLLASKLGDISLIPPTHNEANFVTVRDIIAKLEPLKHGEKSEIDPLHRASALNTINLKRIKQSKQGGTWRDWDEDLLLKCHKKETGKTYVSVYGRMSWDEPSPTITTQCNGLGNGRFGHPEQDRAISLREAALLQTFPQGYKFFDESKKMATREIAIHIGNAVPVELGSIIAKSIKKHLENVYENEN
jgi:DNA (cytosine-5)-methyltransferase 1